MNANVRAKNAITNCVQRYGANSTSCRSPGLRCFSLWPLGHRVGTVKQGFRNACIPPAERTFPVGKVSLATKGISALPANRQEAALAPS